MSFTSVAPASIAATATAGLVVSTETRTVGRQGLYDRDDPAQLLGLAHRLGPRPARLPADVDHVGAGRHELEAVLNRPVAVQKRPPSENESGVTLSTPMTSGRIAPYPRALGASPTE